MMLDRSGSLSHDFCAEGARKCFDTNPDGAPLKLGGAGWQEIEVTKDRWPEVVDVVHCTDPLEPTLSACLLMNLCPLSVHDQNVELFITYYNACRGISRISTPAEFGSLPALYFEGVQIIEHEINLLRGAMPGESDDNRKP